MKTDSKLELLGSVPLFAQCSRKELAQIARLADRLDVDAGSVLAREGATGREFFVIAEGTASVELRGEELALLGPGEFFGEMALLDRAPRSATVTAITPLTVFVVTSAGFYSLLDDAPRVTRRMLAGLARRIRVLEDDRAA